MKKILKYFLLLILPALFTGVLFVSCDDEDDGGTPSIRYVRLTDPAKSDSLLDGAFMGNLIAIVGENLGGAREIWFNDQEALLTPTYVTENSILVNVPSTVPSELTNKIRIVFADGSELLYDFSVNIPAPVLNSIKCEYVPDGEVAILYGDYFFEPQVIFPGDITAVIDSFSKTKIKVIVPEGSTSGPLTVKTKFGKANSKFVFRDNTGLLLDFDNYSHETWTSPIALVSENPEPEPCSGNYTYFRHNEAAAWLWTNELTMQYWAERGRGNIPVAEGLINNLVFRFEANIPDEWDGIRMEIFFGRFEKGHDRDGDASHTTSIARWKPWTNGPFKTDGWITVSIPLSDFQYSTGDPDDGTFGSNPLEDSDLASLTNVTMMVFGPAEGTHPININIDNIRIVPNK